MKYDNLNNPVENQMERGNMYSRYSTMNLRENKELTGKIEKNKDELRKFCSFAKAYPDIFLDMITPKDSNFRLHFYQRLFLRAAMRNKYMFGTFTRGFSKSFLNILVLFLKCIFYPGIKVFICSSGKEQASNIAREKIDEIVTLFPALGREIRERKNEKDYIRLTFHNGSFMDILAIQQSSRGMRRNVGLIDEVILVDGQTLSEVIIPTMNVDRIAKNGKVDENELHKSQFYVD